MTAIKQPGTSLGRRTVLAMAAAAVGFACAPMSLAADNLVDLAVVDRDTGQPLPVWRHHGRLFVAGEPGARYALRVSNNTGGRVLVVMSVDGVNILTGESASYGQRGYVFDPYESYDVTGWRKSDSEVAAFTFASLPESYAARTGRPLDVGVIGIAAFRERVVAEAEVSPARPQRRYPDPRYRQAADARSGGLAEPRAAPSAAAAPPAESVIAGQRDEKLGTAHGAREWSLATVTPFERATRYPQQIRRIEYDAYERLVAAGVAPPAWNAGYRPRPFPGSGGGYVPDPPGDY